MEVLDKFRVWASGIIKKRTMNLLKYLLAAVPQCMPQVALLTRHKFMCEPHLSGLIQITHFVRDNIITGLPVSRNLILSHAHTPQRKILTHFNNF